MRKITYLFITSLLFFSACRYMGGKRVSGNGTLTSEQRNISNFNNIKVVGGMDVILQLDSVFSVKVEADQNLIEHIRTENNGDVLVIAPEEGFNLNPQAGMKVFVTAPVINEMEVVGSGSIVSQSRLANTSKIETNISGSGDIKLDIDAPEVVAQISGSGTVTLTGNTRNFTGEINGSGNIRNFNLLSEVTKVQISGSGDAEVFASKQLAVDINGSGAVAYKGNPAVNQDISGSGSVRKMQ